MGKALLIALCIALVLLGLGAYAKRGIWANATRCFVDATKEQQAANPGQKQYLRDIQLNKVAECAERKNSFLENLFFDPTKIGDYVRISKPTASESKKYDATK
jgi:hypothetical protein